jgi:hypothetical protein
MKGWSWPNFGADLASFSPVARGRVADGEVGDQHPLGAPEHRAGASHEERLGFGRIVASEVEMPNILVDLV